MLTREQFEADLARLGSRAAVAREHGVAASTLYGWMQRWGIESPHPRASSQHVTTRHNEPAPPADPAELVAMRRKVERAEAEARSLKAQLKHAAKHANIVEDVRDMLAPVITQCVLPKPATRPKARASRKRKPLTAVWHLTDLHFDEIVEPSTLNDVNAYSPDIAAARVQHTLDTIIALASNYDAHHGIDELVIAVNGDTFGGAIHPDSAEYAARVARQALNAALLIAQVASEAATVFPRVRLLGTVGNHTRSTNRMPTGRARMDSSWELLMHEHIAALLANTPNIGYELARGYTLDTIIGPSRWAFAHGDAVKGGGGQLGVPAYGLKRQHDANREWSIVLAGMHAATIDGIIKHTRVGHFHTLMFWQAGAGDIALCPSPKGVDPFVKDVLGKYSPPQMLVEIVHPEHDIIAQHPITLTHIQQPDPACRYVWNGSGDLGMSTDVMRDWNEHRAA
jgi:transposase-like protein